MGLGRPERCLRRSILKNSSEKRVYRDMSATPLIRFLCCVAFGTCFAEQALAGTAAFSPDGAHVFLADWERLVDVDLVARKATRVPLDISKQLRTVAGAPDGLLIVTDNALFQLDYQTRKCRRVCAAPAGMDLHDAAFDPLSQIIFLCCYSKNSDSNADCLFFLKKGATKPEVVRSRRVRYVDAPVFSRLGELFFSTDGDIWKGKVELADGYPSLTGERIAPVATRETVNGTPGQMGALELAVAGNKIFSCVRRMGGSGWGRVVSLKRPVEPPANDAKKSSAVEESPSSQLDLVTATYLSELSSLHNYGENGGLPGFLCATSDEKKVFFVTKRAKSENSELVSRDFWLIENGSEPKQIEIDLTAIH